MDRDVVEVVVRFGGTIIDVAHVGPTDAYRIGTAPNTNLAVPGLTCFPLVDAGKIRLPHGMPVVDSDGGSELRVGALTLWIARTKLRPTALGRPRVNWWPRVALAASLIAHLAVWVLAMSVAPIERLIEKPKPRMRLAHIEVAPEPVEPKPPRKHESAAAAQPTTGKRVARPRAERSAAVTSRAEAGQGAAYWSARVAKSFDNTNLVEQLSELRAENQYDEDAANAQGFGGQRKFDPSQREGFESVKSGGYTMMLYDVKLCPKRSCTVTGPIPALYVRTHLHAHMDAIYECYAQHASGPGTIVLEFSITPDGAVRDARGSGLGETGACAARVVGEIYFKALGLDYDPPRETHVRYPLLFKT